MPGGTLLALFMGQERVDGGAQTGATFRVRPAELLGINGLARMQGAGELRHRFSKRIVGNVRVMAARVVRRSTAGAVIGSGIAVVPRILW